MISPTPVIIGNGSTEKNQTLVVSANSMLLTHNILKFTDLISKSKPCKKQFHHAFMHCLSCSPLLQNFHSPHACSDSSSHFCLWICIWFGASTLFSLSYCLISPWTNLLSATSCSLITSPVLLLRHLPLSSSWMTYSNRFLPHAFCVSLDFWRWQ